MSNTLLTEDASGLYVIAATPFKEDGALDLESTDRLIDFYLGCGVNGMTILGVMGEAPKLTQDETLAFSSRVLQRVGGRVPVVVGVSNSSLRAMKALTDIVMDRGAAGVMLAPQPGLVGDDAVYRHIALSLELLGRDVPICLQDFPPVNGVYISPVIVDRLTSDFPQLVMFKHEDNPGLGKLTDIRKTSVANGQRRLSILVGNGALYLPLELRRGADGAMTGFAFPEVLVAVCQNHAVGRVDAAFDLFDSYLPLIRYEQQPKVGIAVRKEILRRRGALASAHVRAPGPRLSAEDQSELTFLLSRMPSSASAAA